MHVWLGDINIAKLGRGLHGDLARFGTFAHDLFVDLTFGWNVNDDVALHGGLTPQSAARFQAANVVIAFFHRVEGADGRFGDIDPVFGEAAKGWCYLAFRTDTPPTTNGIKIHSKRACGLKDWRTDGEAPSFARGGKDDQGIL